jgi:hypothetical protein
MSNNQAEPMALSHVHTTTDYGLFKSIDGNRNLNLLHLNRLRKSMQERALFTIITVNERYEIIDGQHRFEVSKELGLPVHYVMCAGYGINEVHILNANSKTWNTDDYLQGYIKLGKQDYIQYEKFKSKYGFGHQECMQMLQGSMCSVGSKFHEFFSGDFKIKSYKNAVEFAERMVLIGNYYAGYQRRSFIQAMFILKNKPQFEFMEFLNKLRLNPSALTDCSTVSQYITLIEEIYNYRRRDKVNLRY